MTEPLFRTIVALAGLAFLTVFIAIVIPPLIAEPDIVGAFGAGFVNPYASGYSSDVLACWVILSAWILYERASMGIRHGGWCIALGIIPGVAVGFALYLLLRQRQLAKAESGD